MATNRETIGTLDYYLTLICAELQLNEPQFRLAEKRYRAVGEHLTEADTPLDKLDPFVHPQGSMLLRTTVRPMRKGVEVVPFDLDAICRCVVDPYAISAKSLYGRVETRLRAKADYAGRMTSEPRCLRLNYSDDDFYLDVIPACSDPSDPDRIRLLIRAAAKDEDKLAPIDTWKRTDPLRYAAWFDAQCEVDRTIRAFERKPLASVAPIPPYEPASEKAPLRLDVQLMKRQRDIDFLGDDCRPTSILLTTLAGRYYRGQASIAAGLRCILDGVSAQIRAASPARIKVLNPTDPEEDLAAAVTPGAYAKFCTMIENMRLMLAAAEAAVGAQRLYPLLAKSFGDSIVKRAFNAAEDEVNRANQSGRIGAAAAGATLTVVTPSKGGAGVQVVRTSNFHRDW